jgi:3-dehydroquinate synthase
MHIVKVDLSHNSYPIYIGENILTDITLLQKYIQGKQVMVVSNPEIAALYLDNLLATLQGYQCDYVLLPQGEANKNLIVLNQIFDALLDKQHHRDTTLIALGGGIIGDMTGFTAACYQRGVNFIQMPTTLLAQVDASIGGKTAVNHAKGKNMIGAFYQPRCVIIDINTLHSLPQREFCAGLAEIIKAALIADSDFLVWLEENLTALLAKQTQPLIYAIQKACAIKARIVGEDEREMSTRALLNLGHTFAHAIETSLGYGTWLHGEAVAIGLILAAELSKQLGWLEQREVNRIRQLILAAHLPIRLPQNVEINQLMQAMAVDKKIVNSTLRLIALKGIGNAVITSEVTKDQLYTVWQTAIRVC